MGLYGEHVLPRVINVACGLKAVAPLRRRVCEGLEGNVVELGFGSGHNIPLNPDSVSRVAAIEPAERRLEAGPETPEGSHRPRREVGPRWPVAAFRRRPLRHRPVHLDAVHDPGRRAALSEVRRVLKPGGTLHFLEHGLAPDEAVRRWQHRLEPVEKRVFGGCHLTRPIVDLLTGAGFTITEVDVFYEDSTPKFLGADSLGTAVSP